MSRRDGNLALGWVFSIMKQALVVGGGGYNQALGGNSRKNRGQGGGVERTRHWED